MKQSPKYSCRPFLKKLSGSQKILISLELGNLVREICREGNKNQYPGIPKRKIEKLLAERLKK